MNHKPAIDWLFEDPDELSQTQSNVLQEHLADCECCRELAEFLPAGGDRLEKIGAGQSGSRFCLPLAGTVAGQPGKGSSPADHGDPGICVGRDPGVGWIAGFHSLALAALAQSAALDLDLPGDYPVHLCQCATGSSNTGNLGDKGYDAHGSLGVWFRLAQ